MSIAARSAQSGVRCALDEAETHLVDVDLLWSATEIGDDDTMARHLATARSALRDAQTRLRELVAEQTEAGEQ